MVIVLALIPAFNPVITHQPLKVAPLLDDLVCRPPVKEIAVRKDINVCGAQDLDFLLVGIDRP